MLAKVSVTVISASQFEVYRGESVCAVRSGLSVRNGMKFAKAGTKHKPLLLLF